MKAKLITFVLATLFATGIVFTGNAFGGIASALIQVCNGGGCYIEDIEVDVNQHPVAFCGSCH